VRDVGFTRWDVFTPFPVHGMDKAMGLGKSWLSAVVLCGGHRAVEVASMERAFGLTEDQRRQLERAPRGQFLLLAGRRRGLIEVDLPDAYRAMISGCARQVDG